jgi:hypothetical protein
LKNIFDKDGRFSARGSLAGMIIDDKTKEGAFVRNMAEVRALSGLCIVRTSVYCVGPPRAKSDDPKKARRQNAAPQ